MQNINAKCELRHFQQAIQEGQAIKEEVIIKINQSVYFWTMVTFIVAPTAILERAGVTNAQG